MTQAINAPHSRPGARAATGMYMTFLLAEEQYGLQILKVRELIGMQEITRVPRSAESIRGVINLRGRIIPVVDLRVKFALQVIPPTAQSVIIVVQFEDAGRTLTMGLLVDEVIEVLAIDEADIETPPNFQSNVVADFILGIGKVDKRVIFLLDVDRVLNRSEAHRVAEVNA